MTQIAKRISISVGALTTAVNALVRKGYIYRGSDPKDRRIVYLFLTESGQKALKIHADFHEKMVDSILNVLDEQSLSSTTTVSYTHLDVYKRQPLPWSSPLEASKWQNTAIGQPPPKAAPQTA